MQRTCPICNSLETKLLFRDYNRREWYTELTWDFVECINCSMKYLTNIPDFKSFAEKYEDIYVEPVIQELRKKLKLKIEKNWMKVLDVWCNHWTELIKYYNDWFEVFWIDLNKKAIEDCKKYLPKDNFFSSTIENSTFKEEYFDIITSAHVLEHVYDLDSFIKFTNFLLKKWWKIKIRIPHWNSFEMEIWWKYSSQSWIPFHINMFNKNTITLLLKKHWFKNIRINTNPIPWWWILSFRQWNWTINKKKWITNFDQNIFHKFLQISMFPILWLISKFWYWEELEINATKYDQS